MSAQSVSATALIIGGDRVDRYKSYLYGRGYASVTHWDGRRNSECHRRLPQTLDLVVILIDQVSHGLLYKMRRQADERSLPVIYTQRSVTQLAKALDSKPRHARR
jgi:hypothetical protein